MTNQMNHVLDSTVAASQQLGTPWQVMVFLLFVLILIIAALGFFVYKIILNRFQREADISAEYKKEVENLVKLLAEASKERDEVDRQIARSQTELAVAISGLKDTVARISIRQTAPQNALP